MQGEPKMMACGHAANATIGAEQQPCCALCYGVKPEATIIGRLPDLTGRKAWCSACGKETDSKMTLAFFEYRRNQEKDKFYCGCNGWD